MVRSHRNKNNMLSTNALCVLSDTPNFPSRLNTLPEHELADGIRENFRVQRGMEGFARPVEACKHDGIYMDGYFRF